jgi:hypothetical protein
MELTVGLLAFAIVLGVTVKRVGLEVYAALFLVASVASVVFLFLYYRLFF